MKDEDYHKAVLSLLSAIAQNSFILCCMIAILMMIIALK